MDSEVLYALIVKGDIVERIKFAVSAARAIASMEHVLVGNVATAPTAWPWRSEIVTKGP